MFKPWPKIPRGNPLLVTITEKIDGTNGCIIVENGKLVGVQSRKRLISPKNDNYNFAKWCYENEEEVLKLGEGYHYGEWAGEGIQKNPHRLVGKHFFLFNTFRWGEHNKPPSIFKTVPVLYQGSLEGDTIDSLLKGLKEEENKGTYKPEGIIVYYHTTRSYTKHTLRDVKGKWVNEKEV